jgi:hypothetical protein
VSTELLAIVASAIIAVLTVWITAAFHRKINRQTLESLRTLALQERVRTTYEDMLHTIGWVMELVDAREPIIEYAGSPQPEEPDMERVRMVQARIGVHGSREVKAIIERWAGDATSSSRRPGFSIRCRRPNRAGSTSTTSTATRSRSSGRRFRASDKSSMASFGSSSTRLTPRCAPGAQRVAARRVPADRRVS